MAELREYGRIGEQVWYDVLENGLHIVNVEKPDFKKSLAFFAANYGGSDRRFKIDGAWRDTPAGVAHFLEHKMFDMEDGQNAMNILSGRGASSNAFTSSDMTAYHFECVDSFDENLDTLLRFVSVPYFSEESVLKEQGIIGQEICMVEDDADHALYYGLLRGLFKNNPVRDPVAGTVESISHIDADVLYSCHKVFYAPSNMCLVTVGMQDHDRIKEAAESILTRKFLQIPQRDYGGDEGMFPEKMRTERKMQVAAPLFLAGIKAKPALRGREGVKQEMTASLAMSLLMGTSSPLYSELYSKGLINDTFGYDFEVTSDVSFASFGGESRDPDAVYVKVLNAAAEMAAGRIGEDDFRRKKNSAIGAELRALNSFDNIAYNAACAEFNGYDYFDTMNILSSITMEDVCSFVGEYFTPERTAISVISGEEAGSNA